MTTPKGIRPQRRNANRHTQRGMGMLEGSIERDGIIGAMTVAADDEVFDGSARAETLPAMGFDLADVAQVVKAEPGRVLIIESDGSSPLVHRRVDIPSADDPKAQRLGVAANRVAELNLSWEPGVLAEMRDDPAVALGALFTAEEMSAMQPADAEEWSGALGGLPDGDRAPFQQMTFTLSDEQAEQVRAALERARSIGAFVDTGNENGNGNALARVCEVFLGIG